MLRAFGTGNKGTFALFQTESRLLHILVQRMRMRRRTVLAIPAGCIAESRPRVPNSDCRQGERNLILRKLRLPR